MTEYYKRYTRKSVSYRAEARYSNPGYPDYTLLDDHGWIAARICGSHFTVATVKEFFMKLAETAFHPGATLDLSALDDTDRLDTTGTQ